VKKGDLTMQHQEIFKSAFGDTYALNTRAIKHKLEMDEPLEFYLS
jgi:hypothetical protein